MINHVPRSTRDLLYYNTHDWSFRDQGQVHKRLGSIIMHVSPGKNELLVADAAVCDFILTKRKEFIKPVSILGMLFRRL